MTLTYIQQRSTWRQARHQPISTSIGGAYLSGIINNFGTVTQTGDFDFTGTINNPAGATWNFQGIGINTPGPFHGYSIGGTFNNAGNVIVSPPAQHGSTAVWSLRASITPAISRSKHPPRESRLTFTLVGTNGTGDGSFNIGVDCIFDLGSYTFNAGATITGAGRTAFFGLVSIAGDTNVTTDVANFTNLVIQKGATLTLGGTFNQPASTPSQARTTLLNGGTITSTRVLNFGQNTNLSGSGTINGDVISGATISPGASAGTLIINGNVSLLDSSKLVMEIGGLIQGAQYDYLAIGGMVTLDGTLELGMLNGFQLQLDPSQTFTLLTSQDLSGVFDNVASGARLTTADGTASFQVNYGAGSPYGADNVVLSDPQAVPEPASRLLFAGGAMIVGLFRYRRR